MINDKQGPKGASFEAEYRKRVINSKLEAFYQGESNKGRIRLINIESLDPDPDKAVIDTTKKQYYSALEPEKIPRKFTYIIAEFDEAGEIIKANRTIVFMEERVLSVVQLTDDPSVYRRPDFFTKSYELGTEELDMVKKNNKISFIAIVDDFKKRNAKIIIKYFEIKSIDLNTPLDVKGALKHVKKHVETFGSVFSSMLKEFNMEIAQGGTVNVVLKEFYHASLNVIEKNPLVNAAVYFLKEQHTAVFTLVNNGGNLTLAGKVAAEMISGMGSVKKILTTARTKLNPEFAPPTSAQASIKRAINFLTEVQKLVPKVIKFVP